MDRQTDISQQMLRLTTLGGQNVVHAAGWQNTPPMNSKFCLTAHTQNKRGVRSTTHAYWPTAVTA